MPMFSLFITLILVTTSLLTSCASNSGVVTIGADTFMVSRQASSGFSGLGTLKADALREANKYCMSHNKHVRVMNSIQSSPPYVFGNFPRAEIQFMCLDKTDVGLTSSKMKKSPEPVAEVR